MKKFLGILILSAFFFVICQITTTNIAADLDPGPHGISIVTFDDLVCPNVIAPLS